MKRNKRAIVLRTALICVGLFMLSVIAACGGQKEQATAKPGSENSSGSSAKKSTEPASTAPQKNSSEASSYYKGKTITLLIGYAPGGGVDLTGRIVAKHLANALPGKPNIVIKNLPGGGGIAAANVLYSQSSHDGLTIAAPGRGNWLNNAVLGEASVKYKLKDFEWIGGLGPDDTLFVVSDSSGIKTFDDLKKAPKGSVLFGSWQKTGQPYILPYIVAEELAPAIKPVTGYNGSGDVLLALQRGEVKGAALPYATIFASLSNEIKSGKFHIIAKLGDAYKMDANVVQLEKLVSAEGQQMLDLVEPPLGVAIVAPPKTNAEGLKLLRDAFGKMVRDAEFLADAKKQDVVINPRDDEGVKKVVSSLNDVSPDLLAKYKKIISD